MLGDLRRFPGNIRRPDANTAGMTATQANTRRARQGSIRNTRFLSADTPYCGISVPLLGLREEHVAHPENSSCRASDQTWPSTGRR